PTADAIRHARVEWDADDRDIDAVERAHEGQPGERRRPGEPGALERVLGCIAGHRRSLRSHEWSTACDPAPVTDTTSIRAAVLDRPGVPVRIENLELDPPGPGEVRVRMAAAGVCHSDLHVRDGEWEREGPIVIGHEGSAVVEMLGDGVAEAYPGLRPGALVALAWLIPCAKC